MGVLGDMIRLVRDTTKETLEECGIDDLKDEIKDIVKAIKGK
jgi:flagellar basal body-associated protein FliL